MRVALNLALAAACVWGGLYLLQQDSCFLRDRWHPATGTLFSGLSLELLALGLFALGAFAAAVALAWVRGTLPRPPPGAIRTHPVYKGRIIVRYWYLVLPAFALVLGAFILADRVPNPALRPARHNPAAQQRR